MNAAAAEYFRIGLSAERTKACCHIVSHWYRSVNWPPTHIEKLHGTRRTTCKLGRCHNYSSVSDNCTGASNSERGICIRCFCSVNYVEHSYKILNRPFLDCRWLSADSLVCHKSSRESACCGKSSISRNSYNNESKAIRCRGPSIKTCKAGVCGNGGTATRQPFKHKAEVSGFFLRRFLPCSSKLTNKAKASTSFLEPSLLSYPQMFSSADSITCTIFQPFSSSRPIPLRSVSGPHDSRGALVREQQERLHASLSHCRSAEELLRVSLQYISSTRRRHRDEMLCCFNHPLAGICLPEGDASQVDRSHARGAVAGLSLAVAGSPPDGGGSLPDVRDTSAAVASDGIRGPSKAAESSLGKEDDFYLPVTMREAADFGFVNSAHALVRLAVLQSTSKPDVGGVFAESEIKWSQIDKPREAETERSSTGGKIKQVFQTMGGPEESAVVAMHTFNTGKCSDKQHKNKDETSTPVDADRQQQQQFCGSTQQKPQNEPPLLQQSQMKVCAKLDEWQRIRSEKKRPQQQRLHRSDHPHETDTQHACRGSSTSDSSTFLISDVRFLALLSCALHHLRVFHQIAAATVCKTENAGLCSSPVAMYSVSNSGMKACRTRRRVQGRHCDRSSALIKTHGRSSGRGSTSPENSNSTICEHSKAVSHGNKGSGCINSRTSGIDHSHVSERTSGRRSKVGYNPRCSCSGTGGADSGGNGTGEIRSSSCSSHNKSTIEKTMRTNIGGPLIAAGAGGHTPILRAEGEVKGGTSAILEERLQGNTSFARSTQVHTPMLQPVCSDVSSLANKNSSVSKGLNIWKNKKQHKSRNFPQQKKKRQDLQQVYINGQALMGSQQRIQQQADRDRTRIELVFVHDGQEEQSLENQQQPQHSPCHETRQHRRSQERCTHQCEVSQQDATAQDVQRTHEINSGGKCCPNIEKTTVAGANKGSLSAGVFQSRLRFLAAVSWACAKLQLHRMQQQLKHRCSARSSFTGKALKDSGEAKTICAHQKNDTVLASASRLLTRDGIHATFHVFPTIELCVLLIAVIHSTIRPATSAAMPPAAVLPASENFGLSLKRPDAAALHVNAFRAGESSFLHSLAKQKVATSECPEAVLRHWEGKEVKETHETEIGRDQDEEGAEHRVFGKRNQQGEDELKYFCTFGDGALQRQAVQHPRNVNYGAVKSHDKRTSPSALLAEILLLLKKTVSLCLPCFNSRSLSVALWGVAQLQPDLLCLQQQHRVKTGEVAFRIVNEPFLESNTHSILSKYKELAAVPKSDREEQTEVRLFWKAAAERVLRLMHEMTLREIATVVHAFAAANFRHERLLSRATDRATRLLSRAWEVEQDSLQIQQHSHQLQLGQDSFERQEQLSRLQRLQQQRVKTSIFSQQQQDAFPCSLHLRLQQHHFRQETQNADHDILAQPERQLHTAEEVHTQQLCYKKMPPQQQSCRARVRHPSLPQKVCNPARQRLSERTQRRRQRSFKAQNILSVYEVSPKQRIEKLHQQEQHASQPEFPITHKGHSQAQQFQQLQPISPRQQRRCLPASSAEGFFQPENTANAERKQRLQEQRDTNEECARARQREEGCVWKRRRAELQGDRQPFHGQEQTKRESTESMRANLLILCNKGEMQHHLSNSSFMSQKKERLRPSGSVHYKPPFLFPVDRGNVGTNRTSHSCLSKPSPVVTTEPDELHWGPFLTEDYLPRDKGEKVPVGGCISIILSSLVKFRYFPISLFSKTAQLLQRSELQLLNAPVAKTTNAALFYCREGISAITTPTCCNAFATAGRGEASNRATTASSSGRVDGGSNNHQAPFSAFLLPRQHPLLLPSRPSPLISSATTFSCSSFAPTPSTSSAITSCLVAPLEPSCSLLSSASRVPSLYAIASPENKSPPAAMNRTYEAKAEASSTSGASFSVEMCAESACAVAADASAGGGRSSPDCANDGARKFSFATEVYDLPINDCLSFMQENQLLQEFSHENFLLSLKPIEATAMAWAFAQCCCPDTSFGTLPASGASTNTAPSSRLIQVQHASAQIRTRSQDGAEEVLHHTAVPLQNSFSGSPSHMDNESRSHAKNLTNGEHVSLKCMAASHKRKSSLEKRRARRSQPSSESSPSPLRESVLQVKLRQEGAQQVRHLDMPPPRGQQMRPHALLPGRMPLEQLQQPVEQRRKHARPIKQQQQRQKQQQSYAHDNRGWLKQERISEQHMRGRKATITPWSLAPLNRWTAFCALRALSLHAFIFTHRYTIVDRVRLCWALALQDVYIPVLFASVICALEKKEEVQRQQQRWRVQEEQTESPPAGTTSTAALIQSVHVPNECETNTPMKLAGKKISAAAAAATGVAELRCLVRHAGTEIAHSDSQRGRQRALAGSVLFCGRATQQDGEGGAAALSVCGPPQNSALPNDTAAYTRFRWAKHCRAQNFVDTWNATSTYSSRSRGGGASRERRNRNGEEQKERDKTQAKDQQAAEVDLQRQSGILMPARARIKRSSSAMVRQNEKRVFADEETFNVCFHGLAPDSVPAIDFTGAVAEAGMTARVAVGAERGEEKKQAAELATHSEAAAEYFCSRSLDLILEKAKRSTVMLPNSIRATPSKMRRCCSSSSSTSISSGKCAEGNRSISSSASKRSWNRMSNRRNVNRNRRSRTGLAETHRDTTSHKYGITPTNGNTGLDKKCKRSKVRSSFLQSGRKRVRVRKKDLKKMGPVGTTLSVDRDDFASSSRRRESGRGPGSDVGFSTLKEGDRAHATVAENHPDQSDRYGSRRHRTRQLAMSSASTEATVSDVGTAHVKTRSIRSAAGDDRFTDAGQKSDYHMESSDCCIPLQGTLNPEAPTGTFYPFIKAGCPACAPADRAPAPRSRLPADCRNVPAGLKKTDIGSYKDFADCERNVAAIFKNGSRSVAPSGNFLTNALSPYSSSILPYQLQTQFYLALLCYLTSRTSSTIISFPSAESNSLVNFWQPQQGFVTQRDSCRSLLQTVSSETGFSEEDVFPCKHHTHTPEFDPEPQRLERLHESQPLAQNSSTYQPEAGLGRRSPRWKSAAAGKEQPCWKSNSDWEDPSLTATREAWSATAQALLREPQRVRTYMEKGVVTLGSSEKNKCARRRRGAAAHYTLEVHRWHTIGGFARRCTSGKFTGGDIRASMYAISNCGRFHGGKSKGAAEGGARRGRKQAIRPTCGRTSLKGRRLQDQHIRLGTGTEPKRRLHLSRREDCRAHVLLDERTDCDWQMQHPDHAQPRELRGQHRQLEGHIKREGGWTPSSMVLQQRSANRRILLTRDNQNEESNKLHPHTRLDKALRSACHVQMDGRQQLSASGPLIWGKVGEARVQEPQLEHQAHYPDRAQVGASLHMLQGLRVPEHSNIRELKRRICQNEVQHDRQLGVKPWHLALQQSSKFADVFLLNVLLRCRASLEIHPSRVLACRTSQLHIHVLIVLRRLMQENDASTCTRLGHCDKQASRDFLPSRSDEVPRHPGFLSTSSHASSAYSLTVPGASHLLPTPFDDGASSDPSLAAKSLASVTLPAPPATSGDSAWVCDTTRRSLGFKFNGTQTCSHQACCHPSEQFREKHLSQRLKTTELNSTDKRHNAERLLTEGDDIDNDTDSSWTSHKALQDGLTDGLRWRAKDTDNLRWLRGWHAHAEHKDVSGLCMDVILKPK